MKTGNSFNLNLLPSQAKFQAARTKFQGIFRRYMAIAAAIWVLIIVVTVIINIITGISLNAENKKYTQALNSFKEMSDEIVMSQLIKYRIKVLGQVLKDRFEYSTAFEKVVSVFSEKATLSKFEIDANKEFKVVVKATNKEAVDYVEDKVVEANNGEIEGIKEITISSVSYNSTTNDYLINMGIILK